MDGFHTFWPCGSSAPFKRALDQKLPDDAWFPTVTGPAELELLSIIEAPVSPLMHQTGPDEGLQNFADTFIMHHN